MAASGRGSLGPGKGVPPRGRNRPRPLRLKSCLLVYLSWPSRPASWGLQIRSVQGTPPAALLSPEIPSAKRRGRGRDLRGRSRGGKRRMFRNIGSFWCFTNMCVSQISWATALWGWHYCGTCAPCSGSWAHAGAGHTGMTPGPPPANAVDVPGVADRELAAGRPIRGPGRASRQLFPNTHLPASLSLPEPHLKSTPLHPPNSPPTSSLIHSPTDLLTCSPTPLADWICIPTSAWFTEPKDCAVHVICDRISAQRMRALVTSGQLGTTGG